MGKRRTPGSLAQQGGRWYWYVTLPGETRRRGIALVPPGAARATRDRPTADALAEDLWRQAVLRTDRPGGGVTVADLIADYLAHCRGYYRDSHEAENIRRALALPLGQFGRLAIEDFGPAELKACQAAWIAEGLARSTCNKYLAIVKRMSAWSVAEGRMPPMQAYGLACVAALKRGRSDARETMPVTDVPGWAIDATLRHCTPTVAAMVRVQLLTAMRPGEVCLLRRDRIDTTAAIWQYAPERHKTQHRGHSRQIAIGPRAQALLAPRMLRTGYLFAPADSMAEMRARRTAARQTPASQGNAPGTHRTPHPAVVPGDRYDPTSYRRAVHRACLAAQAAAQKAGTDPPPAWTPNQLRHTAATRMREQYRLDAVSAVLGHADVNTTKIYAEIAREKADEVAEKMG